MNPSLEMILSFERVGHLLLLGMGNIKHKTFDFPNSNNKT
jgi:hypothetical protein